MLGYGSANSLPRLTPVVPNRSRLACQPVEWKNKHATKVPVGETVMEKPSELIT